MPLDFIIHQSRNPGFTLSSISGPIKPDLCQWNSLERYGNDWSETIVLGTADHSMIMEQRGKHKIDVSETKMILILNWIPQSLLFPKMSAKLSLECSSSPRKIQCKRLKSYPLEAPNTHSRSRWHSEAYSHRTSQNSWYQVCWRIYARIVSWSEIAKLGGFFVLRAPVIIHSLNSSATGMLVFNLLFTYDLIWRILF
jgi:hypothetical protein